MTNQTLGDRLRIAKKHRKVSNGEIASAAGVHTTTVSRWFSDVSKPNPDELDRAAAFLGVTSSWLRYGDQGPMVVPVPAVSQWVVPAPTVTRGDPAPAFFSARARAFINHFLGEIASAGATAEQEAIARRILTNLDNYTLNAASQMSPADEEAILCDIEGLSIGVRHILTARGLKNLFPERPD